MKKINKSNCIMIIVTFIFLSVFSLALTIGSQTTARWLVVLAQTDESLTITTYYPSPMGVYSELQLFPRAAGTCAAANDEGKMYYDSDSHGLFVCQDVNNVISWQPVGGAGHWDLTGTRLYARDTAWSVGIGTQTPSGRLQVVGDEVRIGDGGTVFFANTDGDLYVENELEVSGIGYINTLNAKTVTIKDALNVDLLNTVSGPQITTESDYNYIRLDFPTDGAGGLYFPTIAAYFICSDDGTDNFRWFLGGGAESDIKMQLSKTGNLAIAGNLTQSVNFSDVRLKKNIEPIRGALDKLTQLRGVNFEWIHPDAHGNLMTPSAGLIAQEVEKIFPGWVLETEPSGKDKQLVGKDEKVKTLFPSFGFEAYVIEAIKELKTQNEALSAQNASLEARILVLEKKFQE